jgi:hypothetical protein
VLLVKKVEAELAALRETVFAGVSAGDLEACLRVFGALQAYTAATRSRGPRP